jgi:hypothetical protein
MQIELQDLTYAACGMSAVLDQATEQLGYDWDFYNGNLGQLTTEGRQYCIRMPNRGSGRSVGYIYGRPFFRHCETKESALIRALTVIYASGYIIRDINYNIWLQRYINVSGPIDLGSDSDSN